MSYIKHYLEAIVEQMSAKRSQGEEVRVGTEIEVECETASGKRVFNHVVTADDLVLEKRFRNP
jgi:hypothetical protein